MFKNFFKKQIDSIPVAALLVALSSLVSRFLGIFRDSILASEFGAGDVLDIYFAAFRIPDLMFNLIVLGALSSGFIPIFISLIEKKKNNYQKAWELVNNVLSLMLFVLLVLSVVCVIGAPAIMKLMVPGFSEEKYRITVNLTRIMFLSPIFLGISSVFGGVLQSFKRFFIYSLSPIVYNIGIIIGALFFVPYFGIYGLAWGVVLGAFLHMIIQLPLVFQLGYKYVPYINIRDENLKTIFKMMLPRIMSLGVAQINLVVITIIASILPGGALAIFNYANNLVSFPVGIFGISFAIAAFPTFSALAQNNEKMIESFSNIFRQILFFVVPSMVLLLTLRAQIIRVIFGRGSFDWNDTLLTMDTLAFFTLSLFAQASIPLLVRIFYAKQDSKTPFYLGLISAVVNLVFALYFSSYTNMGIKGLALAFSISNIVNFVCLWIALSFKLGDMDESKIIISSLKFSVGAICAGLVIQFMKTAIHPYIDMTRFTGVFTQGFVAGISGIIIYFLVCYLLRSEEFFHFAGAIKRRLPFKKVEVCDHGEARGI